MSDELPQGWVSARLEEITEINPRHPSDLDAALQVTFVPMPGVSETSWTFQFTEERPLSEVRKGYTHFAEGDVLFAKITPCMENGKASVASGLKNGLGCGSTELHVLRSRGGIEPKFIYHFMHQESFRRDAAQNFTGTAGQLRVPVSFIRAAEIPLAPLNEQRRIVAKLEKLLGKVETCQERLNRIPILLKRFRQSVLATACSGRLTPNWSEENPYAQPCSMESECSSETADAGDDFPTNWRVIRLGTLTKLVTSGSRGWAKYYSDSGSIFIRAQNINADFLNLEDIAFVTPPDSAEGLRTRVQQYDMLVTITGANVTKSALVEKPLGDAYVSQHVALVRLADVRLSKFLFYSIVSIAHGRKQLQSAAYGQGKPGLNLDNIRDVVVGLPPLAEQQEIVRRVEALFKIANEIEVRYTKAQGQVDKLTQSILAKAFRGELVPQASDDEPAQKLLERIWSQVNKTR